MKIRNDYVTNSSSASYIFGKATDTEYTKDSVFRIVRKAYIESLEEFRHICEGNKERFEKSGIRVLWQGKYSFKVDCGYDSDDNRYYEATSHLFWDTLPKEFGLFDIYSGNDFEWLGCETYEEYLKYFEKYHEKKYKSSDYYPFNIYDFSGIEEYGFGDAYSITEAVDWYDIDIKESYIGSLLYHGDCKNCSVFFCGARSIQDDNNEYKRKKSAECRERYEKIKKGEEENLLITNFGRIMVFSEHELHIPLPVHIKLDKLARYGCNHMG